LIMQLMTPTPMKALRQARNASPSSERRTPGATAINPDLFTGGAASDLKSGCAPPLLPIFAASVY
jgi:hypothetical protein